MVFMRFCLVFLLSHCFSLVSSLNEEGLALLSFKESLSYYYPEGYLKNWNSSDETPCSWNGVTCREEKVISLSIPNQKLSGFLHPALGELSSLHHVNLRNNKFSGGLPVEIFNPKELQSLVLSANMLSGNLPPQIGNLNHLQTLDLSQNLLSGSLPSSLLQCKRLKTLMLSQNNLTGSLPDGFATSLITLQKLNLSFNRLGSSIPGNMGNLKNLQGTLDLSHNLFSGSIPPSLGDLPEELYIDLSYNNLNGPIPKIGVLENMGPTTFIGNPLLCGPPLNISCSPNNLYPNAQSLPDYPSNAKDSHSCPLIALVGVIVGVSLIALSVYYWYRKTRACEVGEIIGRCKFKEALTVKKELFCFAKHDLENPPENMEQYSFVILNPQAEFDLDRLLKASAYLLGKSGTGTVYKVVLEDGQTLAVRRLGDGGQQRFKEFQTEVEVIGKVKHQNIVRLLAYCWSDDEKLLIYDYIPNGDLATALHGKRGTVSFRPLSWPARLKVMQGMAKGLAYLHEFGPRKYVHGDLKPSNILLGQNMEPFIADFGLGSLANIAGEFTTSQLEQMVSGTTQKNSPFRTMSMCSTPISSSYYQAPEASKMAKPSQKWDVYSFGVILLEIISGRTPKIELGSSEMELVQWIMLSIDERKPLSHVLDPFLAHNVNVEDVAAVLKIGLACVHKIPERRPAMRFVYDCLEKL